MEIRRARPQRRWATQRPDNQAKVQVGAMKHSRRANCVVPTNTSHHSTTRPRLCEGHASLTTPINSVKPDKGGREVAGSAALPVDTARSRARYKSHAIQKHK